VVTPSAGTVVLLPFPFSDLSKAKLRPAVVLAAADKNDWILCQVTSNPYADKRSVKLTDDDFREGSLQRLSYARPCKLFTANVSLFRTDVGSLMTESLDVIINAVIDILKQNAR